MAAPFQPRLSDEVLPLMRERFRRCAQDPDLGRTLTARAMADFPPHPGWERLQAELLERIRAGTRRVEHVILVPSRDFWMVVDEAALAAVLPPETTIRLYFGPEGRMDASPWYPTYDVRQCLPLILGLLRELAPASVYMRGSAQFKCEHLGAAVKASLPGLFLAFEVYDYAGMFEDVFLEAWGQSPELAASTRDAEAFLGLRADFLIDKTPGAEWEDAARALVQAPRRAYVPALGARCPAPGPAAPRRPGPFRLLCAGSMPYFKNYRPGEGFPAWAYQNIVDPMVRVAREADMSVDIFNASHDPQMDHWPAFGGYAGLLAPGRGAYHARIPLAELRERVPGYDFGMFLFAASAVPVDYPLQQSLPNRCMSYIEGHLPLIVNREMRCLAELVERFGAGIVLAGSEVEQLPGRIRAADLEAMRRGAGAMHRHLLQRNGEALAAFAQALAQGRSA